MKRLKNETLFIRRSHLPDKTLYSVMVGNLLEESTGSKVIRLFMEDYSNGQYRVNGEGSLIRGVIKPKRSIDLIAATQGLPSPDEVLKNLGQQ